MRSTNPAYWRRSQQRRQIRKLLGRLSIVPTAMLAMMLGALAVLGVCFGCVALLLAGLPPHSGFIAKFAMLTGMLNLDGLGTTAGVPPRTWLLVALIILSGLAALIAMLRAGINSFWAEEREVPRVRIIEMAPVAVLLALTMALTLQAGPAMRYMDATMQALRSPQDYVTGVLSAPRAETSDARADLP